MAAYGYRKRAVLLQTAHVERVQTPVLPRSLSSAAGQGWFGAVSGGSRDVTSMASPLEGQLVYFRYARDRPGNGCKHA